MTYKQPREDVAGSQRSDWLLSLDPAAFPCRDAMIVLARHLHDATLVGRPAPKVARMDERIRSPQVGDLVVEASTVIWRFGPGKRPEDRVTGFGILVEKRVEWWDTDQEWQQAKAEDDSLTDAYRPTDTAWYVQYGPSPGDICRWVNCSFIALLIDPGEDFAAPAGVQVGGAVTVTRDSLIAALADDGFDLLDRSTDQ